jgi:peptidyl-prolyl cis-trans isomerase D
MIKAMRKHARYFYVLFFIVILSFIFWGVGTGDKTGGMVIVAEVGKHIITTEDYWRSYDNVYRFYREIYKDQFTEDMVEKMNLKDTVLYSMINERLLLILAKETGFTVSDAEVQDAIVREPAFMKNGVFDKTVYLNRLRLIRRTPEAYENSRRQELLLTKVRRFIELSVDIAGIEKDIPRNLGDEKVVSMLRQQLVNDRKEKALASYLDGLKKEVKVTIDKDTIS